MEPRVTLNRSAGILIYRRSNGHIEVLLVHPGGPFWRKKDAGGWQLPKGLIGPGESAAEAAWRETQEELGIDLHGDLIELGTIRQAGGKIVEAFALEQDVNSELIESNTFELEWPPKSGRIVSFPEIDAAQWMSLEQAEQAMLKSQVPLLAALRKFVPRGS